MKTRTNRLVIAPDLRSDDLHLSQYLYELLRREYAYLQRGIAVLCIGSADCVGDALGPLVGSELEASGRRVLGTLDAPVHARSLAAALRQLRSGAPAPVVIAVDACLGGEAEIGSVEAWQGSLRAGLALGKKLPEAGDISVVGVVGADSPANFTELRRAALPVVVRLSKTIARSLAALLCRVDDERQRGG